MRVRLFGGLAVERDGVEQPLGSPKQRLVLAVLAVEAGHVVSIDRIVDLVWGDDAPRDPTTSLQAYVSNLRRVLGADAIVTQAPGYRLAVGADAVDLSRVDAAIDAALAAQRGGDLEHALALLDEALATSARPPLPECADRPFGVALTARWAARRGVALESMAEAQLALGRHVEVAATLPAHLAEHPHRERLHAHLALALYRCGRQVDALRTIDALRRALADDVGVTLSAELQALEARILDHDASLDWHAAPTDAGPTRTAPVTAPAAVHALPSAARRPDAPLYGRARELASLVASLDAAIDGRGSPVVVVGEPGIGKTRLVQELAEVAAARGVAIGWGRCPESGASPSFWAANQIAEQLLANGVLDAELFGLLPQHHEGAVTAGPQRFALQVTVAEGLRSARAPMLLVVDDLQWADPATLALLEFVAGELHALRCVVVATCRPTGAEAPRPLLECLGELARQRDAKHLVLDGLDLAASTAWLRDRPGAQVPGRVVSMVHERSGGNPFYLGELVELLESEGRLFDPRLDGSSAAVPVAVQDVVRRRVSRLPDSTQRVLSAASVVGRTFDADVLAAVADLDVVELLDQLDAACTSGLVGAGELPGQFCFSHALVAEALVAELSAPRLAAMHARVLGAKERLRADELDAHLAELAHHAFAALVTGTARKAYDYSARAARLAAAQVAHEDAVAHWRRALLALDALRPADPAARYDALVGLGSALLILDSLHDGSNALVDAARVALARDDVAGAARALARLNHANTWEANDYDEIRPELIVLLEEVLASMSSDEPATRALVTGALAHQLHHADEPRRKALADEAVAIARRSGDLRALVRTLGNRNFANFTSRDGAVRREVAAELLDLLATADLDEELWAYAAYMAAVTVRETGDAEQARRLVDQAAAAAERAGSITLLSQIRFTQAAFALSRGEFDDSLRLAAVGGELYRRGRGFSADTIEHSCALQIEVERGNAAPIAAMMAMTDGEAFAAQWPRYLAWVQAEAGELDAARASLAAAGPAPDDWLWTMVTEATALARLALGDVDGVRASYDELLPFSGTLTMSGTSAPIFDAADTCLARCAAVLGDHDTAERLFAAAIELNERAGAVVWLARTLAWFGEWCLGRGDHDRAEAAFARALAIAEPLGLGRVQQIVAAARAR